MKTKHHARTSWTREKLWAHIDWFGKDINECWNWLGPVKKYGYGRIQISTQKGKIRVIASRLVAYDVGLLPKLEYEGHQSGTTIRHICDNPKCCNPNHLLLGTQKDNIIDRRDRNRANVPCGSRSGLAKLTEADIPIIKELHLTLNMTKKDIGRLFGVSDVAIFKIINRETWRHA